MDRKSIAIIVVSVLVILFGSKAVDYFFPPRPMTPAEMAARTNKLAALSQTNALGTNAPTLSAPINPAAATIVMPKEREQIITISNQNLIYHFTSHGGGLKTIELSEYPAAIDPTKRATGSETNFATLNAKAPVPIMALLGSDIEGDNFYTLSQKGNNMVRAEKLLPNGVRLVKEFEIQTNYLLTAKLRMENTTAQPVKVSHYEVVAGTAAAMGLNDDPTAIGSLWYNGTKMEDIKEMWFVNPAMGCAALSCVSSSPRTEYHDGENNVLWAAVHNQFFTLAIIPSNHAPAVVVHKIALAAPDGATSPSAPPAAKSLTNGYETALYYPDFNLDPNGTSEKTFTFYAGPKEYNRLAELAQKQNNSLDLIMGFSGFFGFFSKFLLLSMNGLHAIGLNYGLTIVAITVILKLIFWPLTAASTRSMKRMQTYQPQLKAIADKYKEDPLKKHQKTNEFMKEHKISPLGGCLPMVLQIPVFMGFYWMLRSAIELRGVHFLWANDLSQADTITYIGGFPLNLLPLLYGGLALWQSHLTPPSPGMDPAQQKMMRFMPVMFIAFFYRMSAGLTLYWTVNTLLTIIQTKMTRTNDPAAPINVKTTVIAPPKKKK